jgi:hypothetical protein
MKGTRRAGGCIPQGLSGLEAALRGLEGGQTPNMLALEKAEPPHCGTE